MKQIYFKSTCGPVSVLTPLKLSDGGQSADMVSKVHSVVLSVG